MIDDTGTPFDTLDDMLDYICDEITDSVHAASNTVYKHYTTGDGLRTFVLGIHIATQASVLRFKVRYPVAEEGRILHTSYADAFIAEMSRGLNRIFNTKPSNGRYRS